MSQAQQSLSQHPDSVTNEGRGTVSILVPAYEAFPSLMRCLGSLAATVDLTRTEILPQDDCSPSYSLIHQPLPPGVIPQRNQTNQGFAGNVNQAALRAQGEYLLILNQDTRAIPYDTDGAIVQQLLRPGWLDALVSMFDRFPDCGIVGPRLVFPSGEVQSVGGLFDAGKGPYHRYLGWSNPLDRRCSVSEKVSWITGAALMIRRDDFMALGGFHGDIYLGGYFEDVHLCMEVKTKLGKEVYYCAEASLVHEVGSTGGNGNFMQNSVRFHQIWDQHIVPDSTFVYVGY
jgi:GT2 family glycosyltransferase